MNNEELIVKLDEMAKIASDLSQTSPPAIAAQQIVIIQNAVASMKALHEQLHQPQEQDEEQDS